MSHRIGFADDEAESELVVGEGSASPVETSLEHVVDAIAKLRTLGARAVKVGDVEVDFGEPVPVRAKKRARR